jgi:hypothetical protein
LDNIDVNPGTAAGKVSVATDVVDDVHYPIYKQAVGEDGEVELVSKENPMPFDVGATSRIAGELQEISRKLSILIKYEAMLHDIDLEENDGC